MRANLACLSRRRAEIQRLILPKENEKDLREIPEHVRAEMGFIPVSNIEELIREALPELAERLAVAKAV